jgi:hypothetical protein
MASSRFLISSQTLASSAASVTFSAIPATYTDLVLRYSARGTNASAANNLRLQFNSDTSTNYSETFVRGNGSTAASSRSTSAVEFVEGLIISGDSATANTYSNNEIYIPSYTVSQNKPLSMQAIQEDNSTTGRFYASAGLWRNTAAITSFLIYLSGGSGDIKAGSSFYLYGIKNS